MKKLSEYAKQHGISYRTAHNHFKRGLIQGAYQLPTGTIVIPDSYSANKPEMVYLYARVSNQSRKNELQYQIDRLITFTNSKGLTINKIFKEIASGMNDSRKELSKILAKPPTKLIVEHKDRLTRFGFNYLETLLSQLGCEIIVMSRDSNEETDLMNDLVSIITSFCCRLYGLRRGSKKALELKSKLNDPIQ